MIDTRELRRKKKKNPGRETGNLMKVLVNI